MEEIPIDSIVGSVSRNNDFTRTFLPRQEHDKYRWASVKVANEQPEGVPPIEVYQIGKVYFVLDGHHRVSVMREIGGKYISAYVQVINTEVPLDPKDSPDELIVKTERQTFIDETHADKILPTSNLVLQLPDQYPKLLEHIMVHKYYMGIERHHDISMKDAVIDWYRKVYMPVVRVIRTRNLLRRFPGKTETEMYLWIQENMAELQAEYGDHLRPDSIAANLDNSSGIKRLFRRGINHFRRNFFMLVTSDLSDWGLKTGDWRKSRERDNDHQLFSRILLTVSDPKGDLDYIQSAIKQANLFNAWIGIVYVIPNNKKENDPALINVKNAIEKLLEIENAQGHFYMVKGNLLRILSQRAYWSDITIMKMRHIPPLKWYDRLHSGWIWIFKHIPGPIIVTPNVIPENIENIVLGFDHSPKAFEAMYLTTELAKISPRKVTVVCSGLDDKNRAESIEAAKKYFTDQHLMADFKDLAMLPEKAILETANEVNAQSIIIGSYSKNYLSRIFVASTVDKILREVTIPVIVCK